MLQTRVIPVLLIKNKGLVKTIKFKNEQYIGDPLNVIKIFNEKEVDELVILDIDATKSNREPNFDMIQSIASECFMPVCYGGGIKTFEQIKKIFHLGIEKISLNSSVLSNNDLLQRAVETFGSQSIVVSVDVKKNLFGKYCVYNYIRKKNEKLNLKDYLKQIENNGAGEILLNNVDLDGTQSGYDTDLIRYTVQDLNIPMIHCGGAKDLNDFKNAKELKVSGVAASSMFVFHGKHKAVLITYPSYSELKSLFEEK